LKAHARDLPSGARTVVVAVLAICDGHPSPSQNRKSLIDGIRASIRTRTYDFDCLALPAVSVPVGHDDD